MNLRKITSALDIATTIMARDYKGFSSSHELSTGVIEYEQ